MHTLSAIFSPPSNLFGDELSLRLCCNSLLIFGFHWATAIVNVDLISVGARMRHFPAFYSHPTHPHQRYTVYLAQEVVLSHSVWQPHSHIKCERRTSSLGNMSQVLFLSKKKKLCRSHHIKVERKKEERRAYHSLHTIFKYLCMHVYIWFYFCFVLLPFSPCYVLAFGSRKHFSQCMKLLNKCLSQTELTGQLKPNVLWQIWTLLPKCSAFLCLSSLFFLKFLVPKLS